MTRDEKIRELSHARQSIDFANEIIGDLIILMREERNRKEPNQCLIGDMIDCISRMNNLIALKVRGVQDVADAIYDEREN